MKYWQLALCNSEEKKYSITQEGLNYLKQSSH